MPFMKSNKQLNTAVWNKNTSFCERWRAALLQPLQTLNIINCQTTGQNRIQFWMQVTK